MTQLTAWTVLLCGVLAAVGFGFRNGGIELDYASVASFRGKGENCSGTFVLSAAQADVLATAAHCLDNHTTGGLTIRDGGRVGETSFAVIPPAASAAGNGNEAVDFALVLFPPGTSDGISAMARSAVAVDGGVRAVSWEPSSASKRGGNNSVLAYNWSADGTKRTGYLIHEDGGGLPDELGESGSPLFSGRELVGVLRGCGQDQLANVSGIHRRGWSCYFTGIHSDFSMQTIQNAIDRYAGSFSGVRIADFISLDRLNAPQPIVQTPLPVQTAPLPSAPARQPPATVAQGRVPQVGPLQTQSQSPTQNRVPALRRPSIQVEGPPVPAVGPLTLLTQSPRELQIESHQIPVAIKPARELPDLTEAPLASWVTDLIEDSRYSKRVVVARKKPGSPQFEPDDTLAEPLPEVAPAARPRRSLSDDISGDLR